MVDLGEAAVASVVETECLFACDMMRHVCLLRLCRTDRVVHRSETFELDQKQLGIVRDYVLLRRSTWLVAEGAGPPGKFHRLEIVQEGVHCALQGRLVGDVHGQSSESVEALDWRAVASLGDVEARLSQLTAWVLEAERRGARYALTLPGHAIALGQGTAHRDTCLRALALFGDDA